MFSPYLVIAVAGSTQPTSTKVSIEDRNYIGYGRFGVRVLGTFGGCGGGNTDKRAVGVSQAAIENGSSIDVITINPSPLRTI